MKLRERIHLYQSAEIGDRRHAIAVKGCVLWLLVLALVFVLAPDEHVEQFYSDLPQPVWAFGVWLGFVGTWLAWAYSGLLASPVPRSERRLWWPSMAALLSFLWLLVGYTISFTLSTATASYAAGVYLVRSALLLSRPPWGGNTWT